jgi:hypothetical protein
MCDRDGKAINLGKMNCPNLLAINQREKESGETECQSLVEDRLWLTLRVWQVSAQCPFRAH